MLLSSLSMPGQVGRELALHLVICVCLISLLVLIYNDCFALVSMKLLCAVDKGARPRSRTGFGWRRVAFRKLPNIGCSPPKMSQHGPKYKNPRSTFENLLWPFFLGFLDFWVLPLPRNVTCLRIAQWRRHWHSTATRQAHWNSSAEAPGADHQATAGGKRPVPAARDRNRAHDIMDVLGHMDSTSPASERRDSTTTSTFMFLCSVLPCLPRLGRVFSTTWSSALARSTSFSSAGSPNHPGSASA